MFPRRIVAVALIIMCVWSHPALAARQIVDLHKLDAYFALFASDSNVPWRATTVRLDTYSSAPVAFRVYAVDPGDVLTADNNARPRAVDTRTLHSIAQFSFTPPGGYQFQSSQVTVPLGSREGFFVVEARRGDVGEQVWINRTRIGVIVKQTSRELLLYGTDLGTGRALAHMRVQFLVGSSFQTRATDAHGTIVWTQSPRPRFALAQWGSSYAFASLLPQAPLAPTIVGVRVDRAVVHAGDALHVVGFARSRKGDALRPGSGVAHVTVRSGATLIAQQDAPIDGAGAFSTTIAIPSNVQTGDVTVLAMADGGVGGATVRVDADAGFDLALKSECDPCRDTQSVVVDVTTTRPSIPVHVRVIRSPHSWTDETSDAVAWGTTQWLDTTVTTGGDGHASVTIPAPDDGLPSTFGVRASAGGASADMRIVAVSSPLDVRLSMSATQQTLGTPVAFDLFVSRVADGQPVAHQDVEVELRHGSSVQTQNVQTDEGGRAHGSFSQATLGSDLIVASVREGDLVTRDVAQVDIVPQATEEVRSAGADVRLSLDKGVYAPDAVAHVSASVPGSVGDALLSYESATALDANVVGLDRNSIEANVRTHDLPGNLDVGVAFVRDGAIDWSTQALDVDGPGRACDTTLAVAAPSLAPGATASLHFNACASASGTAIVRVTQGAPTGDALFTTAPSLLDVGLAATDVSAPAETTWHPWVDSSGDHAQILGFTRRSAPPEDLALAQSDATVQSWNVIPNSTGPIAVQLPAKAGRYTVSVLKIADDGRIIAASSTIEVR